MDSAGSDWLTTLAFAIIGGGLIGLVMGHKIKDSSSKILTTPLAFQGGATNIVLIVIGLGLIALSFSIGIWHGMVALLIGFLVESTIGAKVMRDENGGVGKAVKITAILLLVVCLPFGSYQYYQYNRTPNESDKMAFVYDCTDYAAYSIFKGDSKGDTGGAKDLCYCLWPDLVGKYHTIGAIDKEIKDDDGYNFGEDSTKMYNSCIDESTRN